MNLDELVGALLAHDTLAARQWVADASRAGFVWSTAGRPRGLDAEGLAVAAGIAEMMAGRAGQPPPPWTAEVGEAPRPVWLVRAALTLPRLRRLCEEEGPEPLRRRRVLAPPEFLTAA